jgi:hypothetical protein
MGIVASTLRPIHFQRARSKPRLVIHAQVLHYLSGQGPAVHRSFEPGLTMPDTSAP